ncbi:MAG: VOC family protein [Candidatus Bathyarchaeota archaeon]|nr:MAG: VOC family protein [Candidatus Bathyarchaeota archaeon]
MNNRVKGVITWFYYRNLPRAQKFYEEIMGFQMDVDQGWSKIYKIRNGAYVGLVDGTYGYHNANDIKPVILCLNVKDANTWYQKLIENGLEIEEQPKESARLKVKVFMFKDVEGYTIEIQETLPGGLSI